jgi:hypothetical protein
LSRDSHPDCRAALQLNGERYYQNGPALILSAGGGCFAVQIAERWRDATVVFSDKARMDAAVSKPLSSKSAIDKYLSEPERDPAIKRSFEIRAGIDYRCSALDQTGLKANSFSCALIEQGHNAKLPDVIAEAYRLVRPGGLVVLLGYGPFQAVAKAKPGTDRIAVRAFNLEVAEWLRSYFFGRLGDDERTLFSAYGGIDFPFEEVWAPPARSESPSDEALNMRATWNLHEVIDHINAWPVVKRIEAAASPDIIDLMNFRQELRKAWGSPRKRRVIVWPVVMRIGRKGSGVVAEDAVEPVPVNCPVANA